MAATKVELTVPARINILGNPGDGNEGDFSTISAAIDLRAGATVEPADGLVFESVQENGVDGSRSVTYGREDRPLPYDGRLDLLKAGFNVLHAYSEELRSKCRQQGCRISVWTDVPAQSGLGGSSLFVLLTMAGLREFYELDRRAHNDYVLAELGQQAEAKELGITCGFADRYVPLFGGLAYIDYRGKLAQRGLGAEPLATYERLDRLVEPLPLVLISSGVERDSGDVHGRMRPRYLQEDSDWLDRRQGMPAMVGFMSGAWETAWRGKAALLAGDWPAVGALMNENHRLVDEMMTYCGLEGGAGWANNLLVRAALESGALGAKLTGAGGGGSVFALTHLGQEDRVAEAWRQAAASSGLTEARVYRPVVSHDGLIAEAT
jgi:galactokinase